MNPVVQNLPGKALEMQGRVPGEEDQKAKWSMHHLGRCSWDQGNGAKAKTLLEEVLRKMQKALREVNAITKEVRELIVRITRALDKGPFRKIASWVQATMPVRRRKSGQMKPFA